MKYEIEMIDVKAADAFLIHYVEDNGERQIEGTYQRKADRQNSNKSFVLHNFLYLLFIIYALFFACTQAHIRARHTKSAQNYKKKMTYASAHAIFFMNKVLFTSLSRRGDCSERHHG